MFVTAKLRGKYQSAKAKAKTKALVLWFENVVIGDVFLVDGKNALLKKTFQQLTPRKLRFREQTALTGLKQKALHYSCQRPALPNLACQAGCGSHYFEGEEVGEYLYNLDVAVRSSATVEIPDANFTGQETFKIHDVQYLLEICKICFAFLFGGQTISRTISGFDHFNVAFFVGLQKMVRANKAISGVTFFIHD